MEGIRKFAFLDVDNTLSCSYQILKFAHCLYKNGLFPKHIVDDMAKSLWSYKEGKINYGKFAKQWVDAFGLGVERKNIETIRDMGWKYNRDDREGYHDKFRFTDKLVRMLNDEGFETLAISGSPEDVILPFSEIAGIRNAIATTYEKEGSVYTGKVKYTPVGRSKMNEIKAFLSSNCQVPAEQMRGILSASAGFGDSVHDDFLSEVGYPFVINPGDEMMTEANEKGWPVFNALKNPMLDVAGLVMQRIKTDSLIRA